MPVRAMGRTNSGTFASRASAAAVHWTAIGSPAWPGRAPSVVPPSPRGFGVAGGIIAENGHLLGSAAFAGGAPGPLPPPRDRTNCGSVHIASIAHPEPHFGPDE